MFQSLTEYNEKKYGGWFILQNDGDYADVIFLFRNPNDALVAKVHYIKSAQYNGYVHCCGVGCPACAKNIRVQTKLFIPLYNITAGEIQFWDRTDRFGVQLEADVFRNYPNPSDFVFRITRHGMPRDLNTTYSIMAAGKNSSMPYDVILEKFGVKMPDYYSTICKEVTISELDSMLGNTGLNSGAATFTSLPNYQVTPRFSSAPASFDTPQTASVPDAFYTPTTTADASSSGSTNVDIPDPADEDDVVF